MNGIPEIRRLEWLAEKRMLVREKQRIAARIEELEEIIRQFEVKA